MDYIKGYVLLFNSVFYLRVKPLRLKHTKLKFHTLIYLGVEFFLSNYGKNILCKVLLKRLCRLMGHEIKDDEKNNTLKSYILIANLMHRLLFIYKILFLYMFRAINVHLQEDTLYTCSILYCHSLREPMVASRYIARVLTQAMFRLLINS